MTDFLTVTNSSATTLKPQEGMVVGIIGIAVVIAATILLVIGIMCRIREHVSVFVGI